MTEQTTAKITRSLIERHLRALEAEGEAGSPWPAEIEMGALQALASIEIAEAIERMNALLEKLLSK